MKIENAQYNKEALTNKNVSINATIDGRQMSVPLDPDNTDYAEILAQVKAGTLTIKDAD
tara:strand:- start:2659 stop:2835 length:177 start_codon:yes stop_codon:yes gene_type:complete